MTSDNYYLNLIIIHIVLLLWILLGNLVATDFCSTESLGVTMTSEATRSELGSAMIKISTSLISEASVPR